MLGAREGCKVGLFPQRGVWGPGCHFLEWWVVLWAAGRCLGEQSGICRRETMPAWGQLFIFKAFESQVTCKADAWGVLLKLDCVCSLVCL